MSETLMEQMARNGCVSGPHSFRCCVKKETLPDGRRSETRSILMDGRPAPLWVWEIFLWGDE